MDESNLSVTKMYCLGVCDKILASWSQSEAICGYGFATGFLSNSILQKCGNIFATGPASIYCHSK